MSLRRIAAIVALSVVSLVPAAASAESQKSPCILASHTITGVTEYKAEVRIGRNTEKQLRGAVVHIQAERGLTAEWLRLEVGRHLGAMRSGTMKDCALDLANVKFQIDSAGAGFDVKIIAPDAKQGAEVLRVAKLLQ